MTIVHFKQIKREYIDSLRRHLSTIAPGLIDIMDLYCIQTYGVSTLELLIESPCTFYRIAVKLYGNEETAKFIIKRLFLNFLLNVLSEEIVYTVEHEIENCTS